MQPPAELVERFRTDCRALWPADDRGRLTLAVSGGPDSLALLLLAQAAFPQHVAALTVDHGLRPASASEAAMVAQVCARLGVPHRTLAIELASGNLQHAARAARYDAMVEAMAEEGQGGAVLATAHHADDQAETLLMRLNRASGLAGLAGVRAARDLASAHGGSARLIRPLLRWRKAELEWVDAACGIAPARDPSNEDERFDRVRIRHALAEADWIDPLALAESAGHLGEAWQAIEAHAAREFARAVTRDGAGFRYTPEGIRMTGIEVLRLIYVRLGQSPSRSECAQVYDRLCAGENASLAGVLARAEEHDDWIFASEPPRASRA